MFFIGTVLFHSMDNIVSYTELAHLLLTRYLKNIRVPAKLNLKISYLCGKRAQLASHVHFYSTYIHDARKKVYAPITVLRSEYYLLWLETSFYIYSHSRSRCFRLLKK